MARFEPVLRQQSAQRSRAKPEDVKRRERGRGINYPVASAKLLIEIPDLEIQPVLVGHIEKEHAAFAQDSGNLADGLVGIIKMLQHRTQDHTIERTTWKTTPLDRFGTNHRARVAGRNFRKSRGRLDTLNLPPGVTGRTQYLSAACSDVKQLAFPAS